MTSAVSHVSEDMSPKPSHSRLGPTLAWLARLSLAGVFLAAAAPKLADPAAFAAAIANYQAFPDVSVNLIATLVPTLELIGALALLTPWRRGGAPPARRPPARLHRAARSQPRPRPRPQLRLLRRQRERDRRPRQRIAPPAKPRPARARGLVLAAPRPASVR